MAATTSAQRGRKRTQAPKPEAALRPTLKRSRSRKRVDSAPLALGERAARNTLTANALVGVRRKDVVAAAASLLGRLATKPRVVAGQYSKLLAESARIAVGRSALAPDSGDRRFNDEAFRSNALFKRTLQSYMALGQALESCVGEAGLDEAATARARFAVSMLVDALAPTNCLAGNPAALRKMANTKGASVIRGFANFIEDLTSGTGLPRQVDTRPFAVGKNIANTPGAVVFRNEILEVLQYAPATPEVHARPLIIVPPQINKYYVFDLAPDKSLVRFALDGGMRTFVVSWRNPMRKNADWGIDAYVAALEEALDAVLEITAAADANVMGACSGGITLTALLGSLAARKQRKVHSATLAVCVLDTSTVQDATTGVFVTPATIAAAKAGSRKRGVVEGTDLARMFAWLRPNDLVWNYVVNNYLLGNEPPAHDILFWNNDTTRLPARLHADYLDLFNSNAFVHPGALRVAGDGISVGRIGIETYIVGGLTDHITPWQGVYRTARLYGGARSTFVLSNGGHIQSLINPPGKGRSWFMTGTAAERTAVAWGKRHQKSEGSWWTHWRDWLKVRSGRTMPAHAGLGSERNPAIMPAPGAYVHER